MVKNFFQKLNKKRLDSSGGIVELYKSITGKCPYEINYKAVFKKIFKNKQNK